MATLGQGLPACTAAPKGGGTPATGRAEASSVCPGRGCVRGGARGGPASPNPRPASSGAAACLTRLGTAIRTAQGRAPGSCPPAGGVESYDYRCDAVCCAGSAAPELDSWNLPDTDQTHPPESFLAVLLGPHPHESRTSTEEEEGRPKEGSSGKGSLEKEDPKTGKSHPRTNSY